MKSIFKIIVLAILILPLSSIGQVSLPLDFESGISTSDFQDFDGGVGSVVVNPAATGINTSATVGQIVRNGGQPWAGSKLSFSSVFDFSTDNSISMKVYTHAPIGTQIKMKLEGGTTTFEADAITKTTNAWETLIWNFELAPSDETEIAFMFDFSVVGDGTVNSTFYFDDIEMVTSSEELSFPIDFEAGSIITTDFYDFDGGTATVVANPDQSGINTSDNVTEIVRNGGLTWAGSKLIFNGVNFDFDENGFFILKIYTTAPIGTPIKVKLEGSGTPIDIDKNTTVSGEWETLVYDFTGTDYLYNTLVLMPDIGTLGDGSAASTFYYDDIEFRCMTSIAPVSDETDLMDITEQCEVTSLVAPTATDGCGNTIEGTYDVTLPITTVGETIVTWTYEDLDGNTATQQQKVIVEECSSIGVEDEENQFIAVYPNPVKDRLQLSILDGQAYNVSILDVSGKEVLNLGVVRNETSSIDVSTLKNGVYFLSIKNNNQHISRQLLIAK